MKKFIFKNILISLVFIGYLYWTIRERDALLSIFVSISEEPFILIFLGFSYILPLIFSAICLLFSLFANKKTITSICIFLLCIVTTMNPAQDIYCLFNIPAEITGVSRLESQQDLIHEFAIFGMFFILSIVAFILQIFITKRSRKENNNDK